MATAITAQSSPRPQQGLMLSTDRVGLTEYSCGFLLWLASPKPFTTKIDCTSKSALIFTHEGMNRLRPETRLALRRIVLLVGPEGGFSNAERSSLADRAHSWMLGGRILRAETAVIVGLIAIQMRWGDFIG
ncbi:MAG TPA: RsmE family RNA methyltransferase [Tepidisphaeraceae bacterium]|nr:RsmE family RNA methyltransferase [Tepidisphaeraceae bacterium]